MANRKINVGESYTKYTQKRQNINKTKRHKMNQAMDWKCDEQRFSKFRYRKLII